MIVAGQRKGGAMRLFLIYPEGNFIEATEDTPFLQIGEHKYGKPILDRAITYPIDLYDALKIALVSMDSTMRSNLSVGMPIDLVVVRRDACVEHHKILESCVGINAVEIDKGLCPKPIGELLRVG